MFGLHEARVRKGRFFRPRDLKSKIALRLNLREDEVQRVLVELELLIEEMIVDERLDFKIPRIGVIKQKKVAERLCPDPKSGRMLRIPKSRKLVFKVYAATVPRLRLGKTVVVPEEG